MNSINAFIKAKKAKDLNATMDLLADDAVFITPRWEASGKSDIKKKIKAQMAEGEPEFSEESAWEELKPGRKYTRTMKVKLLLIIRMKVRQTFTVRENGKIKKVCMKKV
eukprot:TRINITY_DN123_c0_g1_i1.p2 TRINITY_DN123_c0_g1~~TRINITY_DN123_c0_g1_i1.p2  ORF type:complete len:109 (+),score=36.76 TRINITY_DN123_c0_g1_i1:63-389(+)